MRPLAPVVLAALLLPWAPSAAAHEEGDDCGTGGDAAFNVFSGPVLSHPVDCVAHFGGADDGRDSFRFEVPPGMRVEVEATPLVAGQVPQMGLFSPDHDDDGQSSRHDLDTFRVAANSTEPGLWGFWLYLYETPSGGTLAHADYRITVRLSGEAWPVDEASASVLVGLPTGSVANAALGPSERDGLDGDWVALATAARTTFLQAESDGCESCGRASYRLADGRSSSATCWLNGPLLSCRVPANATHVLLAATRGADVAFSLRHWRPAA